MTGELGTSRLRLVESYETGEYELRERGNETGRGGGRGYGGGGPGHEDFAPGTHVRLRPVESSMQTRGEYESSSRNRRGTR